MHENLKKLKVWTSEAAIAPKEKTIERMYDASRCLQCGCCLEVCPNFCAGEAFYGTAAAVPFSRVAQAGENKTYQEHVYQGCGKSFACRDICPAKIDLDRMLSRTNALAIWGRR
jgi:succinate dehydrogenase / fumarate reductase iron-sulfur subunit